MASTWLSRAPEQAKAAVAAGHAAAQALPKHELQSEALRDLAELRPRDEGWKKFRRKRVKGPNPLAVKKKKQQAPPASGSSGRAAQAQPGGSEAADDAAARDGSGGRRKRKRRSLKGGAGGTSE
jgi:hypothetical protein